MTRNLEELFREAARLPERDRARLAGLLIESLEPAPEPDVEAAWSKETERRVAELDAGTVKTIPWEEVRAELFGRRNDRQVPSGGSSAKMDWRGRTKGDDHGGSQA